MRKLVNLKAYGESKSFTNQEIYMISNNDGIITFTIPVITLGTPTRNNVIYPKSEFQKAIDDPRIVDLMNRGAFYGEWDHPIDPTDMNRWVRTEMPYCTHKWNKLWIEGNTLYGECQTFTGNGNLLGTAILNGELPAFSIRVVGDPSTKGESTVLHNIILLSIDWVRYPGNPQSVVVDSDAFIVNRLPITDGFSKMDRSQAEASSILNIPKNKELVPVKEGHFILVDKVSRSEAKNIINSRLNCF